MKINHFSVQNYKGIVKTIINLDGRKGSVYTLIGLNESGKTTLLEGINRFRADVEGVHGLAQKSLISEHPNSFIPKSKKQGFDGYTSITANISLEPSEIDDICSKVQKDTGTSISLKDFPTVVNVARTFEFKNSDYKETKNKWALPLKGIKKGTRKIQEINGSDPAWKATAKYITELFPRIVYFPTFLFDFPEKILVAQAKSNDEDTLSQTDLYFKNVVDDALSSLSPSLNLDTHIINRVLDFHPNDNIGSFLAKWMLSDERERVTATLVKLSRHLSQEIFDTWNSVLGGNVGRKEIVIEPIFEESKDGNRKLSLEFKIREGDSFFKISERSLGFRWFFCFLMFTRFFKGNSQGESIFLFDEPASNLNSSAQIRLLDSLEKISKGKNEIIYTTHSHHMINPFWLENAYIITNGQLRKEKMDGFSDESDAANINATKYKNFVGQNGDKSHYFQPILDKLEVQPSLLEAVRTAVLVEGKSDFYILNWYKKYHGAAEAFDVIPVSGATNASAVLSLYLGLARKFIIVLDGDSEGRKAKSRYLEKLPIESSSIFLLSEILGPECNKIEDAIGNITREAISKHYGETKSDKKNISRAFSESLSSTNFFPEDDETLEKLKTLFEFCSKKLLV